MSDYSREPSKKLPEDIRVWARELRGRMTDAEALLWKLLRNRRLAGFKFRRQHPMGRYILDFYCDEKKLCIELDGSQHMKSANYDSNRDAWLQTQGVRVLRFWTNQALTETEGVMEAIYEALLIERPQTPLPMNRVSEPHPPSPVNGRGAGGEGVSQDNDRNE
jgi:very-short-patch-repair endonuclease